MSSGVMSTPDNARSDRNMRLTSKSCLKTCAASSFFLHTIYASFLYSLRANSLSAHVFPTCLAPFNINGFLSVRAFQSLSLCNINRSISSLHFCAHLYACNLHFSADIFLCSPHLSAHMAWQPQHFTAHKSTLATHYPLCFIVYRR